MANKNIDLTKLRDEIDNRKRNKSGSSTNVNKIKEANQPKDSFLNELITSLNTGKQTESTKLIKMVESKAAEKNGETPRTSSNTVSSELNKHSNQLSSPPAQTQTSDRDYLLYEELERKKKEMINGGANYNQGVSQINEMVKQPQQQAGLITENQLNEAVDNIIKDKFAHIVEQAMKDSIVEIYANTRMKEVLDENEDYIKKIVIDTIRGLQKKKKPQE